jgi:hypothetical protein
MTWLGSDKTERRKTILGAVFVFLATSAIYSLTVAPTVSFWDCGEFIASSYILGIPHPPGSPLFILIGRVFTLILPFFDQVALRTNLISVLSSAATAALMFLIILKLLSRWKVSQFARYLGAMVGALFMGYSNTFWANAVETEVYGLSMFLMLMLVYLVLIWMDSKHTPQGDRLLVFTVYLALLSVGVHMTSFLVAPLLFLLIIWEDREKLKDLRIWVSVLIFGMIMFSLDTEIILLALLAWLVISTIATVNTGYSAKWFLTAAIMYAALVGISNQLYIPIRSAQDPAIDENNPQTFEKFTYFFERKQYGDQSMVKRALTRRGQWINQLGDHERMGFWRFFKEQYMDSKFWILPLILGLFGLAEQIRWRRKEGVALLLILLVTTLGLVWYMNFGDGTVPGERLEVRDRDYFFLPGFVFFALFLGLGAAALIDRIEQSTRHLANQKLRRLPGYGLGLVLFLLPALAIANNYHRNDRSDNWIPWDYAHNLLNTCEKDAIMFTNGDNDTFPVWFLQEVGNFRKDIRIVNLSLLNTDWYILQLKHQMDVPITLEDNQIEWITVPFRGRQIQRPAEPYYDPVRNTTHYLFPFPDPGSGRLVRVQDLMIEHIVRNNNWKFPIYFSATVSANNRVGLDNHLLIEGYGYKIVPQEGPRLVDTNLTYQKILVESKYRGLADQNVYKNENAIGLLINYPEKMIELAGFYQHAADTAKATEVLERAREIYPDYWRTYAALYNTYQWAQMPDKKERIAQLGVNRLKLMIEKAPELAEYYQYLGMLYQVINEPILAIDYLKTAHEISPSDVITYQSLLGGYLRQNRSREARLLAEKWLKTHPDDQNTQELLRQLGASQPLVR